MKPWVSRLVRGLTDLRGPLVLWGAAVGVFRYSRGRLMSCAVLHYRRVGGRFWAGTCLMEGAGWYRLGVTLAAASVVWAAVALLRPGAGLRRQLAVVALIAAELLLWTRIVPVPEVWRHGTWREWLEVVRGGTIFIPCHPENPSNLWGTTPAPPGPSGGTLTPSD